VTVPAPTKDGRTALLSLICAGVGLAVTVALISRQGLRELGQTMLSVGWRGAVALLLCQFCISGVLGIAWGSVLPGEARRWPLLVWARMVRDAVASCLPLSAVGAVVFGARVLTLEGIAWSVAGASIIVDMTAEVLAQLAFTCLGLGLLLVWAPHSGLSLPVAIALFAAVCAVGGFMSVQRSATKVLSLLARRIGGRWLAGADGPAASLTAALRTIYRRPGVPAVCIAIHLVGWLASGVEGWIALRLAGADTGLGGAIGIEALLRLTLAIAFIVPAGIGVQEAAYPALGAVFGVPTEMALAVALLRRARTLAIGVPVLVLSQAVEIRRAGNVAKVLRPYRAPDME
jgi:putative membrane protein